MKLRIEFKLTSLICYLALASTSLAKDDLDSKLYDTFSTNVDALVASYVEHHVFDGSVLVAKNGQVVFSKGFGFASKEWSVSNTADSKYGIGSITKSITAILTMQLVEQQKTSLQDTIDKYLPNLPKARASHITIHHLLNHTSGLPNYFAIPGWTNGKFNKSINRQQFSKVLNNIELQSKPGERYQYSNIGYFFLGQIIEKVTAKDYHTVLKENILTPLGMNNTGLHYSETVLKNEATGYQLAQSGGYRKTVINRNLFRGSGDIYSTVGDLFLLEQALYTEKLLSKKSKSIMFEKENSYGWNIEPIDIGTLSKRTINYSGQVLGFNSMMTRFIDDQHSIILLGNIGTSHYHRALLTEKIGQLLYAEKQTIPSKLPLSFMLNKALVDSNIDKQLDDFRQDKTNYQVDEQGIAALAQQIGWAGMSELSTRLFEFNTRLFPNSVASLANLAAIYQRNGRTKDAINYYSKANQLAPENSTIKQQLSTLTQSLKPD